MIMAEVARLLRDSIGLSADTVGESVLQYALKQRMAACALTDPTDYWRRLTQSPEETQELVNAVTVPETWFFRDREAFAAMVRHARATQRPGAPIRILSLPCSSGEEAYSIAMAMFDAGFASSDFTVDGRDVSSRKIPEARRALYGRNSFRAADLSFRDRYFTAVDGAHQPKPAVMNQVRFEVGNLFDPAITVAGAYDIVFCRNLLIYFDREVQARAMERLRQMLTQGGLLLVGPAESSLPSLHGFASARAPMAFAFLKQEPSAQGASLADTSPTPRRKAESRRRPPGAPAELRAPASTRRPALQPTSVKPASPGSPIASPPASAADAEDRSFAAIERSANAGRLEETKQEAHRHMDRFGPSSGVFYLLGLAYDAQKLPQVAVEHYRKALYLTPDHRETLAHLALLLERQGDAAGAKVLTDRLGRIETRSGMR